MRRSLLLAASLLILSAAAANANSLLDGVTFGPSVSTLGIGGELGYRFSDNFGLRGKAQGFNFEGNGRSDDIRYDYDIDLFTAGAIADYYPMGGGFRLSAGGYYNDNHITAKNKGNSTVEIAGIDVPIGANAVDGRGEYNRFAPYAGVGYTGQLGAGFELGFDLGAIYQGDAKVRVDRNNPLVPADDAEDVRRDVKDAMDDLRIYPVVGINATYRF